MKAPGILLLIGGLLVLIFGAVVAVGGALLSGLGGGIFGAAVGIIGGIHIILGILLILAAMWYGKSKTWAWVGLVIGIIALLAGGGLYVGAILGIIGAALALKEAPAKGK